VTLTLYGVVLCGTTGSLEFTWCAKIFLPRPVCVRRSLKLQPRTADENMILAAAAELPSEGTIAVIANWDYRSGIPTADAEAAEVSASSSLRNLLLVFSSTVFPTTD